MAFGNKNSTPSFVLTLPIKATEQDEIFLSKCLEGVGRLLLREGKNCTL